MEDAGERLFFGKGPNERWYGPMVEVKRNIDTKALCVSDFEDSSARNQCAGNRPPGLPSFLLTRRIGNQGRDREERECIGFNWDV